MQEKIEKHKCILEEQIVSVNQTQRLFGQVYRTTQRSVPFNVVLFKILEDFSKNKEMVPAGGEPLDMPRLRHMSSTLAPASCSLMALIIFFRCSVSSL